MDKQKKTMAMEILTPNHERWDEFVFLMMNSKNCCDNTLSSTGAILWEMQDIDIKGTWECLESIGCYCDCEVYLNVASTYTHRLLLNTM